MGYSCPSQRRLRQPPTNRRRDRVVGGSPTADITYTVQLVTGFPYPQSIRAGVTVLKEGGYEGPLDDDQLAAIKADEYLVLESNEPATPLAPTKKQLLADAAAEGLELVVTERDKVDVIVAAIEAAREARQTPPEAVVEPVEPAKPPIPSES
ncbi:hypothetical protein PLANTIT3_80092 [Plantibacter sp. T3]|nr:hypothetical protein PLANTIT3_80092 [Plantibacter sp. T3]